MQHNILAYWQHLQNLPEGSEDLPTPRVCRLMQQAFEMWQTQQPFPEWDCLGHLRDHLEPHEAGLMNEPLAIRRSHALRKTLLHLTGPWGRANRFFHVHPDELIIGTMPPYSVGQGKEQMDCLKSENDDWDEQLQFEIQYLNRWSNFGHICPHHEKIVQRGLRSIIDECTQLRSATAENSKQIFYDSVIVALQGVIDFAAQYAEEAQRQADLHADLLHQAPQHPMRTVFQDRIEGMTAAANRLRRIPAEPCQSFTDAVQCIFLMNCALHWTGELTSLGRLDQILQPYFENDTLTTSQAQEVMDCLWVKLDEHVTLDRRHLVDHFSDADGALMGVAGPSNFDQGGLANQWMQQVTIGGYKATNDEQPEDGCNDVTRMCLHAARKFPFNCPTVDLRVHRNTPRDVLELATRALLSGGAHPILMNDDKLVPALLGSGYGVELRSARNYACDGCYETIFPGETEFSFVYIPAVDALEKALNGGAGLASAGPLHLRGAKTSYRTPPAATITSFEHFYTVLTKHIWLNVNRQISGYLRAYGSKAAVCPSPLLSSMIEGCIESGRDFYGGGARYKMLAPLMTGISTVADSLYVIDHLVFQRNEVTLEELVACLRSNWGEQPEVVGLRPAPARIKEIRQICLRQPRFGRGIDEVDCYAWRIAGTFVEAIDAARQHPIHATEFQRLEDTYGLPDHPWILLFTPGVGTFEQYVFGGSFAGATPDGRKARQPLATDLAASPVPQDIEPILQAHRPATRDSAEVPGHYVYESPLLASLSSWDDRAFERFSDGAPSDLNVREDFPRETLLAAVRAFAQGQGSNIMTVTVANPETFRGAEDRPEDYNLVRVRMGGWTEFFSALYPDHKGQHRRRVIYTA